MKMPLLVAGSVAAGLLVFAGGSPAAPPGRGFHGGRFDGGLARRSFGPAFRTKPFGGGPHLVMRSGMRPEFAFQRRDHFFLRDRRLFFHRNHRPLFTAFDLGAFGFPWLYPYNYGYLYSYPDADSESGYDDSDWTALAGILQSELARRAYYQSLIGAMISSGASEPESPSYRGRTASGGYGRGVEGGQREKVVREPDHSAKPQAARSPLVTPPARQAGGFDRFVLVSWLHDAGKNTIFVEDTDTNEVQKITSEPNPANLRIVEVHANANPRFSEVVITNGAEQGPVRFRFDPPPVSNPPSPMGIPGQTATEAPSQKFEDPRGDAH